MKMRHINIVIAAAAGAALVVLGCASTESTYTGPEDDNNPPEMAAVRDTTIALGDTVGLFVSATDPDGDDVTYRLTVSVTYEELMSGYEADASLGTHTGYFWFRPSREDVPSRDFKFTADDGRGGEDDAWMTVSVTNWGPWLKAVPEGPERRGPAWLSGSTAGL